MRTEEGHPCSEVASRAVRRRTIPLKWELRCQGTRGIPCGARGLAWMDGWKGEGRESPFSPQPSAVVELVGFGFPAGKVCVEMK